MLTIEHVVAEERLALTTKSSLWCVSKHVAEQAVDIRIRGGLY